jgi:hypothetical protein
VGSVSLQHTRVRRSTCRRLCPPAMFRPRGLVTPSAAYSLRTPAGFISHRRRSWDDPLRSFLLSRGTQAFPPACTHLPFLSAVIPAPKALGRPTEPRFLGFDPRENPSRPITGLACQPPDAPLGFALLGPTGGSLAQDFARAPLTCFCDREPESPRALAPQSLTELPLGPIPCVT